MLRLIPTLMIRKASDPHRATKRFNSSERSRPLSAADNVPLPNEKQTLAAGEPSTVTKCGGHNKSSNTGPPDPATTVADPEVSREVDSKQHEHVWDMKDPEKSTGELLREQVAGIFADASHDDAGKGKVKTTERGLENPTAYGDWEYDGHTTDFD